MTRGRPARGVAPARGAGFERDRMTIAFYSCFVVWGWLLYSFNPSVPLLADDLRISDAQAGLHGTAMAVGGIVAAFVTPRVVVRWGRRVGLVASCALVAAAVVALVSARSLAWSLSAMLALALGGNAMVSCAQVGLALRHERTASAAITEANGVGSSLGLVGPLAVGACVAVGWGWRPAVLVTAALAVASCVLNRLVPVGGPMTRPARPGPGHLRGPVPVRRGGSSRTAGTASGEHLVAVPAVVPVPMDADALVAPHADTPGRHRFGLASWCFLAGVVAAIAIENATTYWSTNLVREQTGAGPGIATATTAGLVAGMSLIRFVVGPLSLRVAPAALLTCAFGVAIVGWAIVWTASQTWLALAGLFVAGLGYGAQYPLSIALLLETAPGASDAAQARATLAGGLAIGVAPFLLGALADAVGTHTAFVVVPAFAVLGGAAVGFGGVLVRRQHAAALRG